MIRFAAVATFLSLGFTSTLLAQTAELSVSGSNLHQTVEAGSQMQVSFSLLNSGPEIARGITLVLELPPGVTLDEIYGDGTTCDYSGLPLRCTVDDISPLENFIRHYTVSVHAEPMAATYTITAKFASTTPDPHPENNILSATFENVVSPPIADLRMDLGPWAARVDPGATCKFSASVSNFIQRRPPGKLRIQFDAPGAIIETIDADDRWTCSIEGAHALCTAASLNEDCWCSGNMSVTVRASEDRKGGQVRLRAAVTSDLPDPDETNNKAEAQLQWYRWLAVTTTAGEGPGSLRGAIEEANAGCGTQPCKIAFEIPGPVPLEGWFTIAPGRPLPPITADRIVLEGHRQTAVTGDTNPHGPEIAIDGRFAHRGLEVHSNCEAVVEGLAIGNFGENQGLWVAPAGRCTEAGPDQRYVAENYIGLDPSGTVAWPNRRGLRADDAASTIRNNVISGNRYSGIWMWQSGERLTIIDNRIGTAADGVTPMPNGASGIFVGPQGAADIVRNTIAFNWEMGIAAARGIRHLGMAQNVMKENGGLGIDWALDGISPINFDDTNAETNAPTLLSARYDPANDRTTVIVTWQTRLLQPGTFGNFNTLQFFANRGPDGDGEIPLQASYQEPVPLDGAPFEVHLAGDHRSQWINATGTRHWEVVFAKPPGNLSANAVPSGTTLTSEVSNAVFVH